jgi:hypothetical protein
MADSLSSKIKKILMESTDLDLSGKYALFTVYTDNTAILHLTEDRGTYENMKHRFTSNDGIKRLGATRLPENTTFRRLTESLEEKFNVPKESISVRSHAKEAQSPPAAPPRPQTDKKQIQKPFHRSGKPSSVVESVIRGKERFSRTSTPQSLPKPVEPPAPAQREPSINSFLPASSRRIDLSRLHDGENPPNLG